MVPQPNERSERSSQGTAPAVFEGIRQTERDTIVAALIRNRGNRTKTAREMGITRRSLYYRIKKHAIR